VEIAPANRAMLYCSDVPRGFESSLSEDKTKVNIVFEDAEVSDTARVTRGRGIIEDVYIQTKDDKLNISVVLSEKRGYTAVPLPYSRALLVDVFRWDKINPAEDSYRTGLLALEDGLRTAAKKYFVKAIKAGDADAAAMLGIMLIREGEIEDAMDNLQYAIKSDTKIPDAYAGLSQVYSIKNDGEKARKYSKLFAEKTGLNSFPKLKITPISDDDSLKKKSLSHLARLEDAFAGDSIFIPETDSLATQADSSIAAADTARKDTAAAVDSLTPPWFFTAITYVIIIGVVLAALIIYLYVRWRKRQLSKQGSKPDKDKFQKSLQSAQKTAKPRAARAMDAYQKSERIHGGRPKPKPEAEEEAPKYNRPSPEELDKLEQKELQDMLSQIRNNIESVEEEEEEKPPTDEKEDEEYTTQQDNSEEPAESKEKYSPKIQLAMHLREEQQKLKKQNLSSLDKEELPTDVEKLSKIAKKLGIEKGGLETRKALENMESDKELMEKLKSRFSKK
jgi:hypothetical protein